MTGTVAKKGKDADPLAPFGFIRSDLAINNKNDIFFQAGDVVDKGFDALKVGDRVHFDVQKAEPQSKGPKAVNVKPLISPNR